MMIQQSIAVVVGAPAPLGLLILGAAILAAVLVVVVVVGLVVVALGR